MLRCRVGTPSPNKVLRGRTSGVLLVLLLDEPEMEAWTEATTLAWSGGTYLTTTTDIRKPLALARGLLSGQPVCGG